MAEDEIVQFDNVGLRYGTDREVLSNVSFTLFPGRFYFLTGASGAGKTSLLKLLYLAQRPSRGAIRMFGTDVITLPRDRLPAYRRRMGVVFQDFRLVDHLSGGERQRVWLAMLLAQNTRYLLLDEPTSALDIAHQVEVLSRVHDLSRELGLGVLVVLHDVNMAARYCDHMLALHSGRLLAQGNPAELMRGETLERIYGVPMGIMTNPADGSPISYLQ